MESPDRRKQLKPFHYIFSLIRERYDNEENPVTEMFERELQVWYQWFADTYPRTGPLVVLETLENSQQSPDFRIPILAYPDIGFSLLCALDACYTIDKAMCGTSASALAKVKALQSMDRFEYLNSEELIEWWESAFCQLDDDMERGDSSLLSITLRVDAILMESDHLGVEAEYLHDIKENNGWGFDELPIQEHLEGVEKSISRRAKLLATSSEILTEPLEKFKRRDGGRGQVEKTKDSGTNYRGQDIINEGWPYYFSGFSPKSIVLANSLKVLENDFPSAAGAGMNLLQLVPIYLNWIPVSKPLKSK